MALLTPDERRTLTDLLLRMPNSGNAAARSLLLDGLPRALRDSIPADNAAAIHVRNIVNTADEWAPEPGEQAPILLVIDNALYTVRGSGLARELQALLDAANTRAGQAASGAATQTGAGHNPAPNNPTSDPPPSTGAAPRLPNLSGSQYRQLQNALLAAFPTLGGLAQMVLFGLGQNLAAIAGNSNLQDTVFSLIQWAQAQGRLTELVVGALDANPTNPELVAFAAQFGLTPPAPTLPPPSTPPPTYNQQQAAQTPPTSQTDTPTEQPGLSPIAGGRRAVPTRFGVPSTLTADDNDLVRGLLQKVPALRDSRGTAREAFLTRAGLNDAWILGRSWDGDTLSAVTQLVQGTFGLGTQIVGGRQGYKALGAVLDQALAEGNLGVEDGRALAALLVRYKLVNFSEARISEPLQNLLQFVPRLPERVDGALEAALRQASDLMNRYLDAQWLSDGARVTQAVCQITTPKEFGTGFLIGPDLVLTNNHVMRNEVVAWQGGNHGVPADVTVIFGYRTAQGKTHVLAEDWLVASSPIDGLDFALLRLQDAASEDDLPSGAPRGYIEPTPGAIKVGDPLFIIQHPRFGGAGRDPDPLRVVLSYNSVQDITRERIRHLTNTEGGSSGSPCFNENWKPVALHSRRDPEVNNPATYNLGIPFATIVEQPEVRAAL
jgi:hypothetical protein